MLGICFGVQSLNVWRGGSLVQDLTPAAGEPQRRAQVAIAHTAAGGRDSLLASLLTAEEAPEVAGFLRLPVNTQPSPGGCRPRTGLAIVARSPEDGVIEAVEMEADDSVFHVEHPRRNAVRVGVQWHPERSFDFSAASGRSSRGWSPKLDGGADHPSSPQESAAFDSHGLPSPKQRS